MAHHCIRRRVEEVAIRAEMVSQRKAREANPKLGLYASCVGGTYGRVLIVVLGRRITVASILRRGSSVLWLRPTFPSWSALSLFHLSKHRGVRTDNNSEVADNAVEAGHILRCIPHLGIPT